MDIKNKIANSIGLKVEGINYENLIAIVQEEGMGDYCIPCFSMAKVLRKSPVMIAVEIKESITNDGLFEKVEVVNGYLNFYLNKAYLIQCVLKEANSCKDFYSDSEYSGKTICMDYSSVNLAKYMHIGHLSTTIIGESIARISEAKGYKVVKINYIGDYGTPFGKMVYAYLTWGNEAELESRGVDYLQELYVEFCRRAEEDKTYEEKARECFKKIEEKDSHIYPIYEKFIDISKEEAKELLDLLDVKFDSWKGESSYTEKLEDVVTILNGKGLLTKSEGALVVNLEEYNLGCCLIQKSDGTSLYATRDIAAAIDRYNEYGFDKMYYVTAVQQKVHFAQFFKVLELMGYKFSENLNHIYYGMFSLPTGKIASRRGKQAVLRDLMEYSYNKVLSIVKDREFKIETKEDVARKIAISALKYNAIKNERIKDSVFDIENCFSFDGDTSAYMQYCYARMSSILRKVGNVNLQNIDFSYLQNEAVYNLIFNLNLYKETLNNALKQNEPSIISKYALNLCKLINKFYVTEKVLTENEEEVKAKVYLLTTLKQALKNLFNLICIETIEEM